ncbi:MAG: AAA family ATPase [Candidatus Tectimicrobiota bacterium]
MLDVHDSTSNAASAPEKNSSNQSDRDLHVPQLTAADLAQRCKRAKLHTNGHWAACCPAHDDRNPSLEIFDGNHRTVARCHAGCPEAAVLGALGVAVTDLRPARQKQPTPVVEYSYCDAAGHLQYQVVRYYPKTFRQRRPDPVNPGAWIWDMAGVQRVLYRLPEVLAAVQQDKPVYLVEGEKSADALAALGVVATCSPGGAGKWSAAYAQTLQGAHVAVLPDNDEPGRKHADHIAAALQGVAASVKVVALPGLPSKGDVVDWLAQGGTATALQALVEAAPEWSPTQGEPAPGDNTSQYALPAPVRFKTMSARELLAKELPEQAWVIPDILPSGCTLFAGRGKDGKSLMMLNCCVAVATGGTALGTYQVQQGDVLYLALEDGERRAQTRLKEQLAHIGHADAPDRLELVLWDAPRVGQGFEEALTAWLDEHPEARLVVVDILEKVRPHRQRNGSVYEADYSAVAPLQRIAQERNVALVIVHHSNKTRAEDFRDTASGSTGLIGACDTFWSLQRLAGKADASLHITGRDVESQELAMQFQDGFWTILGEAEEHRLGQTASDILDAIREAGKPLTPGDVAKCLSLKRETTKKALARLADRGFIRSIGDGRYIPSSLTTPHTHTEREGESRGERERMSPVSPMSPMSPVSPMSPLVATHREARGHDVPGVSPVCPRCVPGLSIGNIREDGHFGDTGTPGTLGDALNGQNGQGGEPICYICRGRDFHQGFDGQRICNRCHPRPTDLCVAAPEQPAALP